MFMLYILYNNIYRKVYLHLFVDFIQKFPNTFICRNLASLCMRSIASVTRRMGLDRKNETGRFTEFRDFAENGKLIILSREGRSNERTSIVLRLRAFPSARRFSISPTSLTLSLGRFPRSA